MGEQTQPDQHMAGMQEQVLRGGQVTGAVRVGDTVRRPAGRGFYGDPEFVRDLLLFLERTGWAGAPRFLGSDRQGRQILTFLDGHVAWDWAGGQPEAVSGDASLARAGELTRELHDLTTGTALAGDSEVVCHNDLWPGNIVYRDLGQGLRPVAFIDWDLASPGERIHDVARLCWQYAGWWEGSDPAEVGRRSTVICDGYGLADRSPLVETVLWWQERCWRGIDQAAEAGDSAMAGLRASGAVEEIKAAHAWVERHREELH
ncbi:phosphotransferase [Streptosporangium sp. 'caverna']|uniref:phosphotransferase n=1 Tax=Streptosporangium sp. 'caverna' TaxID=2202249 RepID=UPI001EF8D974|nr:phosphotransferase [Streptosporangium sp. 'caverna']